MSSTLQWMTRIENLLARTMWRFERGSRRAGLASLRTMNRAVSRFLGIPRLPVDDQARLRGSLSGRTILVHGNGLSSRLALPWARQHFGSELLVLGMNASPMDETPDYYLVIDANAMISYSHLLDPDRTTILVAREAMKRVRRSLRFTTPEQFAHIARICHHARTLRFRMENHNWDFFPSYRVYWPYDEILAGPTVGSLAVQLALWMLTPPGYSPEAPDRPTLPGRILVTGLDGYDLSRPFHINPAAPGAASHAVFTNTAQSAILAQVFSLAECFGVELWNLSRPDVLPVNRLERHEGFDREWHDHGHEAVGGGLPQ